MNEGTNCFVPEIIQAGFGMLPCRVGQATPKPGEPHQNRCTVFDEGENHPAILTIHFCEDKFWDDEFVSYL